MEDGRKVLVQKKLNMEQMITECAKEYLLKKGYSMERIIKNEIKEQDVENAIKSCCITGTLCIPKMQIIKNLILTQEAQKRMKEVLQEQMSELYYIKEKSEDIEKKKENIEKKMELKKSKITLEEKQLKKKLREEGSSIETEKLQKQLLKLESELTELETEFLDLESSIGEEFEESLTIERGFVVCIDNKGKYKISRITSGEATAMDLEVCRDECKDRKYKVIGSFHVHPNNIMIPSLADLEQSKNNGENVLFVGGMIYGKPVVNAFYLKQNITWKNIFNDVRPLPLRTMLFYQSEFMPSISVEQERNIQNFKPIRKMIISEPETINEAEFKKEWKEQHKKELLFLTKEEINNLWDDTKYDFIGDIEREYHEEEMELYKERDLIKINEEGKKIFSKYFNTATLEL